MVKFKAILYHRDPIRVDGDKSTKIILEADGSQIAEVLKLLTLTKPFTIMAVNDESGKLPLHKRRD